MSLLGGGPVYLSGGGPVYMLGGGPVYLLGSGPMDLSGGPVGRCKSLGGALLGATMWGGL